MRKTGFIFDTLIVVLGLMYVFIINSSDTKNWDIIPYMGIVERHFEPDIQKVHTTVYRELRNMLSADDFHYFTYKSCDRCHTAYTDIGGFEQILSNYRTRSLSVWVACAFRLAGCSLSFSTLAPSYLAVFLIVIIVYLWLSKHHKKYIALPATMAIMLLPGFNTIQNSADPGAVSGMLILLALYNIANSKPLYRIAIIMILSVFARVDNMILAAVFIAFQFYPRTKYFIISFGIAAVAGAFLVYYNIFPNLPGMPGLRSYLDNTLQPTQWRSIYDVSIASGYLYFLAASALPALYARHPIRHTVKIIIASATLHLLLFPVLEPRFFAAYNTAVIVLLAVYMSSLSEHAIRNKPVASA